MNERYQEVLAQYEMEVLSVRKGRGSWICETDKGLKLLREYRGTVRRLEFEDQVLESIDTRGFGPKGKITREQIASILWRLAGKPVNSASLRSYTDYASVSDYAYDAMSWAVGSGYVKGSGAKLSPRNNATRAEVAVMLHRYLTK